MKVKLKNVYVAYSGSRKPAIRGINLALDKGIHVITGPNGAGKTTLLETILGLLKPYKGEAYLFGVNTKSRDIFKVRRMCSYVPQDFMKPPTEAYTGLDVVKLGLVFNQTHDSILELAEKLDALDLLDKPFGKLSGGQQQKIIILRALARNPELLLLDEPFSSLDGKTKIKLCDILKDFEDKLVLIVCHDTSIVKEISNSIIKMEEGKIVDIS
jgi:ABC-type Mn2+/Zn2+ transport system ATPase subunit